MFKKIMTFVAAALGIGAGNSSASPPSDRPPRPKWQPNIGVDIERTAKTFAYYLDGKHSFAVLKNGTCVGLPEGTTDPQAAAEKIMHAIFWAHPDMNPRSMDDGNWMIWYSQPAGTVVFSDVVEENWAYIDNNHLDGLATHEVLLNAEKNANQFDRLGKIALFGRAYMFMDAISPKVVKVWHPNDVGQGR